MPPSDQLALALPETAPSGLKVRRASSLYGVHAYHTKVPPDAIVECIESHTQPGDLVLDPFCGSGMTGVAAALSGRRAFLTDLSPAAVHIASNYATPCAPEAFAAAVARVLAQVGDQIEAMYRSRADGRLAVVEYVVWSDVRACRECGTPHVLWDLRDAGLRRIVCPACGADQAKSQMELVGERAVETNLSAQASRRIVRPTVEEDLGVARLPASLPWTPDIPFGPERPMWRRGHADLGIRTVSDFYSRRNLAAMALLWDAASEEPDERLRNALRFSLTAIANRASRRYQWNPKRPTNVLAGTLYISSLRYEWNVLSLWRRKTRAVAKLFAEVAIPSGAVEVKRGSATRLPLPDASIDYCFTDPPFGAHIVYSDASLLWEAWLDDVTNRSDEAIVVAGGTNPKTVDDYGALLLQSFREIHRVLKPDCRATVVFQATDPEVWRAVQGAASGSALALLGATTLEKGQPSFKQIKGQVEGERVATSDVVLTFVKSASARAVGAPLSDHEAVAAAVDSVGEKFSIQHIFAASNALVLAAGGTVMSFDRVRDLAAEHVDNRAAEAATV